MARRPRPDTATLLKESAEAQQIIDASPNGREVARSLGPFATCDTPTLVEKPTGEFQVNVTDERATPEENRRRWGLVNEAMAQKRRLETERSMRRAEGGEERVTIRNEETGEVREIRADMEDRIARKKWARPGARRRKYFFMGG